MLTWDEIANEVNERHEAEPALTVDRTKVSRCEVVQLSVVVGSAASTNPVTVTLLGEALTATVGTVGNIVDMGQHAVDGDGQYSNDVGNGIVKPMVDSWEQGKYGDTIDQGAVQVALLAEGASAAKGLIKGGGAAAAEVGEVANNVSRDASMLSRVGEVAAEAATDVDEVTQVMRRPAAAAATAATEAAGGAAADTAKAAAKAADGGSYASMYRSLVDGGMSHRDAMKVLRDVRDMDMPAAPVLGQEPSPR